MSLTRRDAIGLICSGAVVAAGAAASLGTTRISYQLYTSRKFGNLARTLEMLSRLGYANVEGGDSHFGDRAALVRTNELLTATGLNMPSGHVGLDTLARDPDWAIEAAMTLGVRSMYCAWLPPDRRPGTARGYRELGRRLSAAGRPLREAGLGFGWHNHDFEFTPLPGGEIPLVAMFEGGPDLEWQADIGWIVRGGADPLRWVAEYRARLTSVHVKDVAPPDENAAEDGWANVGAGIVPWEALMPVLRTAPVRTYVAEHDNPRDDERFARTALAAMRSF